MNQAAAGRMNALPSSGPDALEDRIAAMVARRNAANAIAGGVMFAAAASSIAITVGIVAMLTLESAPFFREVALVEFLTDTMWAPLFAAPRYGILPLVTGTFLTTIVALAILVVSGWLGGKLAYRYGVRVADEATQAEGFVNR